MKASIYRVLLLCLVCLPSFAHAATPADVRLVVDISGSMKQTDPANLRIPALELLIKLLPDGSQAGVWTFGEQVVPLTPFDKVDERWRENALQQARALSATGLYTNIGGALEKSVFDHPAAEGFDTSVILLTDGKVDIDKNARRNAGERERILSSLLPDIQQEGVRLHTIALSADADAELLKTLSETTDGLHATVSSADELMPAFLQIFDQSVPAERLPLIDNRFLVDDSVSEFTALVFRGADAEPAKLMTPSGKKLDATSMQAGLKWYAADSYDLVTVSNPEAGEWQLAAANLPENRVSVISDLTLKVESLPNNLVAGQQLNLRFGFTGKNGQRLTDPDFLQLLTANTAISKDDSPARWDIPLAADAAPVDGLFSQQLPAFRERGTYQLTLVVDGKTFAREYQHQVRVGSLLGVEMTKQNTDPVSYRIDVSADTALVQSDSTAVVAHVRTSAGYSELRSLELIRPGLWRIEVTPEIAARYSVSLNVSGIGTRSERFSDTLPTQYFTYPDAGSPQPSERDLRLAALREELKAEQAALDQALNPDETNDAAPEPDTDVKTDEAPAADEVPAPVEATLEPEESLPDTPTNWLGIGMAVLGNLLLVGLIYFAYRKLTTRNISSELDEIEQQLNPDAGALSETPEANKADKASVNVADDDPMAALDALAQSASEDDELFPLDDTAEPPMDDLMDDDFDDKKR